MDNNMIELEDKDEEKIELENKTAKSQTEKKGAPFFANSTASTITDKFQRLKLIRKKSLKGESFWCKLFYILHESTPNTACGLIF